MLLEKKKKSQKVIPKSNLEITYFDIEIKTIKDLILICEQSKKYEGDAGVESMGRTAVDNQTVRTVFIIRPDKRIGLFLTYPMATGRNFNEILRAIDSMQLTVKHKVATPANWNKGEDVIIVPAVKDDEAKKL